MLHAELVARPPSSNAEFGNELPKWKTLWDPVRGSVTATAVDGPQLASSLPLFIGLDGAVEQL